MLLLAHKNTYLAAGRQFFIVRVVGGFLLLIGPVFSQNAARDINGSGGRRQVYCCWVKRRHCKACDVLKVILFSACLIIFNKGRLSGITCGVCRTFD